MTYNTKILNMRTGISVWIFNMKKNKTTIPLVFFVLIIRHFLAFLYNVT